LPCAEGEGGAAADAAVEVEGAEEAIHRGDFRAEGGRGRGEDAVGDRDGVETLAVGLRRGFECCYEAPVALGAARGAEIQRNFLRIGEICRSKREFPGGGEIGDAASCL